MRLEEERQARIAQQEAAAQKLTEAQSQIEALQKEVEAQSRSIKSLEATLVHKSAQLKIVQVRSKTTCGCN